MTPASSRPPSPTTETTTTKPEHAGGASAWPLPELVDLEVPSVLRRLVLAGHLPLRRAELTIADVFALSLHRASHRLLVPRRWGLRQGLTVYGASYIALAETLGTALATADSRLASAPGLDCETDLMARTLGEPRASP